MDHGPRRLLKVVPLDLEHQSEDLVQLQIVLLPRYLSLLLVELMPVRKKNVYKKLTFLLMPFIKIVNRE